MSKLCQYCKTERPLEFFGVNYIDGVPHLIDFCNWRNKNASISKISKISPTLNPSRHPCASYCQKCKTWQHTLEFKVGRKKGSRGRIEISNICKRCRYDRNKERMNNDPIRRKRIKEQNRESRKIQTIVNV